MMHIYSENVFRLFIFLAIASMFLFMPPTLCSSVTLNFALFISHFPVFLHHFLPVLLNV